MYNTIGGWAESFYAVNIRNALRIKKGASSLVGQTQFDTVSGIYLSRFFVCFEHVTFLDHFVTRIPIFL